MLNDYNKFIESVKNRTGINLSLYKEAQMKRRLETLRDKRGFKNFSDYFVALTKNKDLMEEFLDRVTINVTEFFRNAKRWEVLEKKILPNLIKNSGRLKIWSAACSTGEEPYTIAMIISKFFPLSHVQIVATDLDETVLKKAKKGIFPERSFQEMPTDMARKYFVKQGEEYLISDEIKNVVQFRKHNLLEDCFENDYDLIVCRNVMIYFTDTAKDVLFHKFNKSLKQGGFLFVGSTEQIFNPSIYGFESEETFFYRKN